ncbi:MAG: glycosyltransferase family 9 protein [Acidobacteria bacterium]|nr:glycosyltransferase family 9 protein [Acidobacteriota bacterium]
MRQSFAESNSFLWKICHALDDGQNDVYIVGVIFELVARKFWSVGEHQIGAKLLRTDRMSNHPQHILVVHVAGLAQTTLALPALRSLRAHMPESRITVAASTAAADLIRLADCADEVLAIGRFHHAEVLSPKAFFRSTKAINELRHAQFDLAIEFRKNAEATVVLNFAHPYERLKSSPSVNKGLSGLSGMLEQFSQALSPKPAMPDHLAHAYLKKLEPLGVRPIEAEPHLKTDPNADEQFEKLLKKHAVTYGELLVGIHPGAGTIQHRWPLERFVSIASRLIHNFNARVLVFAGPQERGLAKQIVAQLPAKRAIPMQSPKIPDLVSAFARLSVLVANHSGPAHVAAAAGAPVAAISTFVKDSSTDVLSRRCEHIRASHVAMISEEAVYEAACKLLKTNRAEFLRQR